jgi:hypothetical protein
MDGGLLGLRDVLIGPVKGTDLKIGHYNDKKDLEANPTAKAGHFRKWPLQRLCLPASRSKNCLKRNRESKDSKLRKGKMAAFRLLPGICDRAAALQRMPG